MPKVTLEGNNVEIHFSWLDKLMALKGNMSIPLSHVTNAYVSSFEQLALAYRIEGVASEIDGAMKMDGFFRTPEGIVFADLSGDEETDCLVLDTTGEEFKKVAVTLEKGASANELAHQIMAALPDAGPEAD